MKAAGWKEFGESKIDPKEFSCKDIGYDCSWKHTAKTEELLLDVAALHLRDAHGVQALGTEMLGKVKNSFRKPSAVIEYETDIPVMKEFLCRDIGADCNWRYFAQTEELIVDGAAVHAREAHGIKEFTPEMIAKVKNAIHLWEGEKARAA
jgi:predicted small metal-binding protein